jgi:hypothetical protein
MSENFGAGGHVLVRALFSIVVTIAVGFGAYFTIRYLTVR